MKLQKASKGVEEIFNSKQKHKWTSEQMQVPQQTEGLINTLN